MYMVQEAQRNGMIFRAIFLKYPESYHKIEIVCRVMKAAVYSRLPNKRRPTLINFWDFFQGLLS